VYDAFTSSSFSSQSLTTPFFLGKKIDTPQIDERVKKIVCQKHKASLTGKDESRSLSLSHSLSIIFKSHAKNPKQTHFAPYPSLSLSIIFNAHLKYRQRTRIAGAVFSGILLAFSLAFIAVQQACCT
jgi:hypothetical protein